MANFLLIARFTFSDVPLRLFDSPICAEAEAKRIHDDRSLLETKWQNSIDAWNDGDGSLKSEDFIAAVVLCIDAQTGYPTRVTFDSTHRPF